MPEAPEVEAVLRALRPHIEGCTIRDACIVHPIAIKPQRATEFVRHVRGQTIQSISRRGKYLLLNLSRGLLVLHFKFDGQLILFDRQPSPGVHVDVLLHLDKTVLAFVDPRHFGRILWYPDIASARSLSKLGLDVFSPSFTVPALAKILRRTNRFIKSALLDQSLVAGIGNIYSSEALWQAKLNPRKRAGRLKIGEIRRLHSSVVAVLRRAVRCCSEPPPDFRNPGWWFADLDKILRVYQREGRPCRRCGSAIRRIELAGRSTYFCPRCQR